MDQTLPQTTQVQQVTDDDFAATVLESERPVVVDFWAAWCPPCRRMDPVIRELAAERPEIRFVKLDGDANQRTVIDYSVMAMPTFLVFRHGLVIDRIVGARPKRQFARALDAVL